MRVRDYRETIRYHAVVDFEFHGDVTSEPQLRDALAKEILANDGLRRAGGIPPLFPGSLWQKAAKEATFPVAEGGVARAVITFEHEEFRCRISEGGR